MLVIDAVGELTHNACIFVFFGIVLPMFTTAECITIPQEHVSVC